MGNELFKNIPSKVGDLVKDVRNGRIGLPDLQRPFVWKDNKVRELFDSMLKGYPIGCYEMTLVKGKIACQKQIFEQGHVRRAETIRIPALATLLYVDWLPQVNGPPGALLSSVVDHESAIIVNT